MSCDDDEKANGSLLSYVHSKFLHHNAFWTWSLAVCEGVGPPLPARTVQERKLKNLF